MIILSHRGLWQDPAEKNSENAFRLSFDAGFGSEVDVRDLQGELVVSHDMPTGGEITLHQLLDLIGQRSFTLAFNIKSDGLADKLGRIMQNYPNVDWFTFDMSVPDQRMQMQAGNPVFTRMSEVEVTPIWLDYVQGVWMDSFEYQWFDDTLIDKLLDKGKRICIVSPELHGRDPSPLWEMLAKRSRQSGLMLCTDHALEAKRFFKEMS